MAEDRAIRRKLVEKTGWSPQNVSYHIGRLSKYMSRQHALYVLARQKGVDIEKSGVDPKTLLVVGDLIKAREVTAPSVHTPSTSKSSSREVTVTTSSLKDLPIPPSMSDLVSAGHKRSAHAYPLVAILENAIRELIRRVLQGKYGNTWWEDAVPTKIKDLAVGWMQEDAKDPWHEPRGDHPLNYLSFGAYSKIIIANWALFKPILERQELVKDSLHSANVSRRVIAHTGELSKDDFDHLKVTVKKWLKILTAKDDEIPK